MVTLTPLPVATRISFFGFFSSVFICTKILARICDQPRLRIKVVKGPITAIRLSALGSLHAFKSSVSYTHDLVNNNS